MQSIALGIVVASGLWLIGIAALMALHPRHGLHLLERMADRLRASDWRLNLIEQGLRVIAGFALLARAPLSKLPWLFEGAGWLLVATSLLILVLPLRWHGAYGGWLSGWLTPVMLRLLALVPAVAGGALIYLAA